MSWFAAEGVVGSQTRNRMATRVEQQVSQSVGVCLLEVMTESFFAISHGRRRVYRSSKMLGEFMGWGIVERSKDANDSMLMSSKYGQLFLLISEIVCRMERPFLSFELYSTISMRPNKQACRGAENILHDAPNRILLLAFSSREASESA